MCAITLLTFCPVIITPTGIAVLTETGLDVDHLQAGVRGLGRPYAAAFLSEELRLARIPRRRRAEINKLLWREMEVDPVDPFVAEFCQ